MNILVINCGSSSLKYQLIDMVNEELLAKGIVERIGMEGAVLTHKPEGKDKAIIKQHMNDHKDAIKLVLDALINKEHGVISDLKEIGAVGHRVVHGGENYSTSVLITDEVMSSLQETVHLAPLHSIPNMIGMTACSALMPEVPMVAVFDTAFHQTMPDYAYMYAVPYELYEKKGIRRYGFHGTSHRYVSQVAADMLHKDIKDCNFITCHLGNGASIAAVKGGVSIDTSMGFTPLEGLVMGTRCGDMDPAIVTLLMEDGMSAEEINTLMNKNSGIYGVSGVSSDFRDVEDAAAKGNKRAKLALDMFYYRVRKYIGSYVAALGSVDAIVFAGGLGENSPETRDEVTRGMKVFGIEIDLSINNFKGRQEDISSKDATVKTLVIPTNEELMIARDTKAIVKAL